MRALGREDYIVGEDWAPAIALTDGRGLARTFEVGVEDPLSPNEVAVGD